MCTSRNSREEDCHAHGVTMYAFLKVCRFLILCFAMMTTHSSCEKTGEACVDLQFTGGSGDNGVQVNEEGDAHINFVLSDNCADSPSQAVVKLSTYETGRAVDFCTIVLRNNTCTVSDGTIDYRCINTGYNRCSVSWKVKTADKDKLLMLRLTNISTKEEKVIFLNITEPVSKYLGTPEIIGICCGIIVAVVSAAVAIKKWKFQGSCARQLQGQVKEDRQPTSTNVVIRKPQRNTGTSSGRQAQEDIQERPGSLKPSGCQQLIAHQTISSVPTIPKRRRRVYNHIRLPSDTVSKRNGGVYNHIKSSTHRSLSSHTELKSFSATLDVTATRSEAQVHSYTPLSRNIVTRSDAELYSHSISFAATAPESKREVYSHRSQKPPDDKLFRTHGQLQIHSTCSSQKEIRINERHALPSRKSDPISLTQVCFTLVPSINQKHICNNALPTSCTGARSLEQLYNNILPCSCSARRSQAHTYNHTTQCAYSDVRRQEPIDTQVVSLRQRDAVSQEPVQSDRVVYDQAVLPKNHRRQVVKSMYDYISY